MPTVLTPQGWVKVAPAPRKKPVVQNPKVALRGPLAYLACQPQAPQANAGGGGVKGKAPFPYDLNANPEKLKRQSQRTANRTVSAPLMHGALHHSKEEEDQHSELEIEIRSPSRTKPKSKISRYRDDDSHSIASSSSSSSSRSGGHTSRSYDRHRPRPVEARPHPPPIAPSNHYYATPYNHYVTHSSSSQMPVHMSMPMPMPPNSGRSLSYSWYNATTPLNLN